MSVIEEESAGDYDQDAGVGEAQMGDSGDGNDEKTSGEDGLKDGNDGGEQVEDQAIPEGKK